MRTRCIVIAWELGFGVSYLNFIRALCQTIIASGHRCVVISKDLPQTQLFLGSLPVEVHQAPVSESIATAASPTQTSYATLLFHNGFHDTGHIAHQLQEWIRLFRSIRADVIIARHSPTALLAARSANIPAVHYGNSFSVPPPCRPWPSFRPDLSVNPGALSNNDTRVTGLINDALDRLNFPTLDCVQDIFAGLPTLLLDYPELDTHAGLRDNGQCRPHYLGFPALNFGSAPTWAEKRPLKVFLSLLPHSALDWTEQLATCGAEILLRVRGTSSPPQPQLNVVTRPTDSTLNFAQAVAESDLVVGYGSHNLVCEALLAGKPVAVITHSADELMLGQRVAALGMGIVLPSVPTEETQTRLHHFIHHPGIRQQAQDFCERHASSARAEIPQRFFELTRRLTNLG